MQDSLKVKHLAHNQENVGATPTPALNVDKKILYKQILNIVECKNEKII